MPQFLLLTDKDIGEIDYLAEHDPNPSRLDLHKRLHEMLKDAERLEPYIEWARASYADDDIEIDDFGVAVSEATDKSGVWVQAWVWVSKVTQEGKDEEDDDAD